MSYKISHLILFFLPVFAFLPFFNFNLIFQYFNSFKFTAVSSVWCSKSLNGMNFCKFKNVCYNPKYQTLLFFLGDQSVIKGLSHYNDFKKIQLSSLTFHNQFYTNLTIVSSENSETIAPNEIVAKSLIFSRFKPNNIMHVIHDDLFPVFLTLEYVCLGDRNCMKEYSLVMHDNNPEGPYFDLYKLFSKSLPILLNKLPDNQIVCFSEMLSGLSQHGTFYQYGFDKPHGPVINAYLSKNDIQRFTSFVKDQLKIDKDDTNVDIVLISRQRTRKILNIEEVKKMVIATYQHNIKKSKVKLLVLDLGVNKTVNFIKAVSRSNILIGMHGAEMIFGLFMKSNSLIIELFPYGIQPDVVSFIKPVSQLEGNNVFYCSWRNMIKNNSQSHPDAHPLFGGINHLDKTTQEKIKNTNEVPPVKCCNDPVYLYYMYQDTLVSGDFKNLLNESLAKYFSYKNHNSNYFIKKWFYPYIVFNATCQFESDKRLLLINWCPPYNVKDNLKFSLYVKAENYDFKKELYIESLSLKVKVPAEIGINAKFHVWISVHYDINNSESPDLYFTC